MIAQSAEEIVSAQRKAIHGFHLQEANVHRGVHELGNDLGSSMFKVSQGDCGYFRCFGHGDSEM